MRMKYLDTDVDIGKRLEYLFSIYSNGVPQKDSNRLTQIPMNDNSELDTDGCM